MLDIIKTSEGGKLVLKVAGRIDAETSYLLDDIVSDIPDVITALVIDMDELEYVSSSGLRAMLTAAKRMKEHGGTLTLTNVPEIVSEVFEMTGLESVFDIA